MSATSPSSSHQGVLSGTNAALIIALVVLKLTGVIGWSWWWIAAPLWIPAALLSVILLARAIPFVWRRAA